MINLWRKYLLVYFAFICLVILLSYSFPKKIDKFDHLIVINYHGHYINKIKGHSRRSNMLNIETSADKNFLNLTYDIVLKDEKTAEGLASNFNQIDSVTEVILIASKNDVDY